MLNPRLVEYIFENDVTLVGYRLDDQVQIGLPLTSMDQAGRRAAKEAIDAVCVGGRTNLSGGLIQGLQMLCQSDEAAREQADDLTAAIARLDQLAAIEATNPQLFKERAEARMRTGEWPGAAEDAEPNAPPRDCVRIGQGARKEVGCARCDESVRYGGRRGACGGR